VMPGAAKLTASVSSIERRECRERWRARRLGAAHRRRVEHGSPDRDRCSRPGLMRPPCAAWNFRSCLSPGR
jgi:hypothetical protein